MEKGAKVTVYLLHFDRPISPAHTTQHYIGWAKDLDSRLRDHARGHGAVLLRVAKERGIGWSLARTWPGATRNDERALKNRHEGTRLCPTCNPSAHSRGLLKGATV